MKESFIKFWRVKVGILFFLLLQSSILYAAELTNPVGNWQTIDDKTGQPRSIVKISLVNQQLEGTITRIYYKEGEGPDDLCNKCRGERRNQPFIGMKILWGLHPRQENIWAGGTILDPENGKEYRCKLELSEDGKTLVVRGFIGISLLGRSQTWYRV